MDVFRAVEQMIYGVLGKGGPVDDLIEREFVRAKQEARFLFGKDLNSHLSDIWRNYVELKVYRDAMRDELEETGQYGVESKQKVHDAMGWLSNCSDNLSNRFSAINPSFGDSHLLFDPD